MPVRVVFGTLESGLIPESGEIHVAAPLLRGNASELVCPGDCSMLESSAEHFLSASNRWICTAYSVPVGDSLEQTTCEVFERILAHNEGSELVRVWNFVPRINDEVNGLENYRAFCVGRHNAFQQRFGDGAADAFCAASAVGVDDNRLTVFSMATHQHAHHVENPLQSPAYRYPQRYGPRPPSFSRATLVRGDDPALYVSGTAAVRHSDSLGDTLGEQLRITGENLDTIIAECLQELDADAPLLGPGECRIYLRHAKDLETVNHWLETQAWCSPERTTIVRSDICRAELLVEIELSWPDANP